MKYYICTKEGAALNVVREITEGEYKAWRQCTERLKYYSMAKHFRDMAVENGLEVERYLKKIQNLHDPAILKRVDADAIGRTANRLMLNYLVSFRTYVDNLEVYSRHIINGSQFRTYILSWIYDKEVVYAFFYHLRNFATHYSVIFDKVTLDSTQMALKCSKEHLLEYREWKPIDKKYISSCVGDSVPILDGVSHLNVLLMSIYIGFIECFAADIQDMHNKIMPLMHEYQILNPLFIESESAYDFTNAHIFGLGLEVLKEVTDELAKTPNANVTYISPDQVLKGDI